MNHSASIVSILDKRHYGQPQAAETTLTVKVCAGFFHDKAPHLTIDLKGDVLACLQKLFAPDRKIPTRTLHINLISEHAVSPVLEAGSAPAGEVNQ